MVWSLLHAAVQQALIEFQIDRLSLPCAYATIRFMEHIVISHQGNMTATYAGQSTTPRSDVVRIVNLVTGLLRYSEPSSLCPDDV